MPCSIMGSILNPFLASSADAPAPLAWTAAEKPCGNPAAMIPEMGIPGIPPRRFCMATMESMLPINPPFMKSGGPRLDVADSETDRRGLGISLRGRRPRRREPGSLLTGSVRIRVNMPSGRKPCTRRRRRGSIFEIMVQLIRFCVLLLFCNKYIMSLSQRLSVYSVLEKI